MVIANGATDSSGIDYDRYSFGMFIIPAAFTGASVSFKVSSDGTTYFPVRDSTNTLISQTVTVGNAYQFPDEIGGARYVKIVSASAEGAARTILIMAKG